MLALSLFLQHCQATPSFGSTAKVVGSKDCFDLDQETLKPKLCNIPRILNPITPLLDTLALQWQCIAPVAADTANSSRDEYKVRQSNQMVVGTTLTKPRGVDYLPPPEMGWHP